MPGSSYGDDAAISGSVVVNEDGIASSDVRVESDTSAHMLFIDASENKVGINDSSPISELSVGGLISITAESSTPSQPADGHGFLYTKSDGKVYWRSYDISETDLTAGGGGGVSMPGIDDQTSSNDDQLTITDSAVIINEDSDDVDFRVESNDETHMLFVDAGNDTVHIGESLGGGSKFNAAQDFTGSDPHGFASDGIMGGDIIKIGNTTVVLSNLYFLTDSGAWTAADADASATAGPVMLALALGTNSGTHGMLVRGFARISSSLLASTATAKQGDPVYVGTTAGALTFTAPSASGDIVRIVGYLVTPCNSAEDSIIYFNPDRTYLEIA